MKLSNLRELFVHELKDVYDAEHQLVDALPEMADAANDPDLKQAFLDHLEETRGHVTRLEQVFAACGEEPERESCKGMKGLIGEGEKLMKQDAEPEVTDAALIGAAQRVEHYEMAAYGTLRVWARTAGLDEVDELLEATLEEEKAADEKLTELAEAGVNAEAETAEDDEEEPSRSRKTARRSSTSRSRRPARAGRSRR